MFNAKTVILASGGAGQAYKPTTNGLIVTGDGIAQAYRIGARLMDMEMVQYHPTTLAGNGLLITEGARRGRLAAERRGRAVHGELRAEQARAGLARRRLRAEQTEINEGRGFPDGTVALDITKVPRRRTLEALREIVNIGRDFAGVDITREPIHIKPGNHYIMGGVKTDVDGQTTIPGLYAAGEVACVSVHGGNRLGANSLLDTLIFGRRSGEHAASRPRPRCRCPRRHARALNRRQRVIGEIVKCDPGGRRIASIKDELGETMNEYVAVFRDRGPRRCARDDPPAQGKEANDRDNLNRTIDDRGTVFNQDVIGAIELGYMLDVAEAIVVRRWSARSPAAPSSAPISPSATTASGSSTSTSRVNGDDVPKVSYSPVTITKWEPQERTY